MNISSVANASRPLRAARAHIHDVVLQHVEEAAHLRHVRSILVQDPQVRLPQLAQLDERIAAHLDGISVAGAYGASLVRQALERPGVGEVFAASVGAITDRDEDRLDKLLSVTDALRVSRSGLLSAFGWVSATDLRGITRTLLETRNPWRREVGLASCAMHGVDPGAAFDLATREQGGDEHSALRARAFRAAGQCAGLDRIDACLTALSDADERCRFAAAWSAVLLGDRTEGPEVLARIAGNKQGELTRRLSALRSVLKAISPRRAQSMLATLAKEPVPPRVLIQGIAIAGDPHYVPWLIAQMTDPKLARVAGEALSFITGLDLVRIGFEGQPAESLESSTTGDPADDSVTVDEDENLPWPDPEKIAGWWRLNSHRFTAGTRYFIGEPPSVPHCLAVLGAGFQRQRAAAAEYLCLLRPGTPLFNTTAPAWRQQRLLGQMRA